MSRSPHRPPADPVAAPEARRARGCRSSSWPRSPCSSRRPTPTSSSWRCPTSSPGSASASTSCSGRRRSSAASCSATPPPCRCSAGWPTCAAGCPVLVGCLLLFALGSLLTATADGLGAAVLGRGLQGIGAGGLVPATLALVADRWPPERRALPLGVVGAVQEAGAVLGPLAGAAVLARRRLAGHLLAQPAAGARSRRRGARLRPGRRPDPRGARPRASSPASRWRCSWPRRPALVEDVTARPALRARRPVAARRRPRWSWSRSWPAPGSSSAACSHAGRRRAAPARAAAAGPRGRRAGLGAGRRRARQPGVGVRRRRPVHADRRARSGAAADRPARGRRASSSANGAPHDPVLPLRALRPTGAWGALRGQPAGRRRAGGRARRRPAVRPQHHHTGRPARVRRWCCCGCWSPCRSAPSPVAGCAARCRRGWSPRAAWRWRRSPSSS